VGQGGTARTPPNPRASGPADSAGSRNAGCAHCSGVGICASRTLALGVHGSGRADERGDGGVGALPEPAGQVRVVGEGVHCCRLEAAVDVVPARLHVVRERGDECGGDALAQRRAMGACGFHKRNAKGNARKKRAGHARWDRSESGT
jgi:hypothetical protein